MFDESTIIWFGPRLQGKTIAEALEDRMECRHWLGMSLKLTASEKELELYNYIGRLVDEEGWVDWKFTPKKDVVNADYVVKFGKFKGMQLGKIPLVELKNYLKFFQELNPSPDALEFLQKSGDYLLSL